MKFKLSTVLISVFLAGLLLYGFTSLNSDDPYLDYAPETITERGVFINNGNPADTTPPANWPYPTAWNFYYSGSYGGTVGANWFEGKYYNNRWSGSTWYRYLPNGPGGGPGDDDTITAGASSSRDMTVAPDGSGTNFLWAGTGSTSLRKFDKDGVLKGSYSISGANFRAIAWDPNRKGFWNASWDTDIRCHDTTGTLLGSFTHTTAINDKYGMAWDSSSSLDSAFLWVWHQQTTTLNRLTKIHLGSMTIVAVYNFPHAFNVGIAGGAATFWKDGKFLLALNYQMHAIVAYELCTGGGNPGFPESFEGTTFPPEGWGKFNVGGGTGWKRLTVGTTPIPGWTGGVITAPPGGETAVAFCTWNTGGTTSNDQYLYTPQISGVNITDADSITYWLKRTYNSYADTVELRVSTTTPTAGGFSNLLKTHGYPASGSDTNWVRFAVSLSSFAGQNIYVAWREKVADNYNNGAAISLDLVDIAGSITGVTNNQTPGAYDLSQNYPNPFNPTTTINFSISKPGLVTLKVYDLLGKEVATLVNDPKVAGSYSVNFNGENLSSGVYFYRLEANDFVSVKRMMFIK